MDYLKRHIEALVFCAPNPLKTEDLQNCLSEMFEADVPSEDIEGALEQLKEKFKSDDFSFELLQAGGGWQFLTKAAYQESIGILLKQTSKKRLSKSALETLSIIAYKQPVTKPELEQIRGVNCDYAIRKLLDKELVELRGKSESVGKPLLYGTSPQFLEYFGINSISELPTPKDFTDIDNEIGEENDD